MYAREILPQKRESREGFQTKGKMCNKAYKNVMQKKITKLQVNLLLPAH